MPFLEILAGIVTAVCLGGYLAVVSAYRAERMAILWDPFADPLGAGYQIVRSLTAVGSGGFWGQGPGEGVYKFYTFLNSIQILLMQFSARNLDSSVQLLLCACSWDFLCAGFPAPAS